ncbi:MAG: methylmalonyl-CoA epimerase [Bdellovibrionota bacterium]
MSVRKINHIGIVVKDIDASIELYKKLLGIEPLPKEFVPAENVTVAMFPVGESRLELVMSHDPNSGVNKFIEKRGEGIHHICLETGNIEGELSRLKGQGAKLINETKIEGAHDTWAAFVHPKSAGGVLVELAQPRKEGGH